MAILIENTNDHNDHILSDEVWLHVHTMLWTGTTK